MIEVPKEAEKDIVDLQVLEQSIQNVIFQKQNFQAQLIEVENALKEVEKTKEKVYRLIGNVLVLCAKEDVKKDLNSRKEIIDLRIKSLENQEKKLKEDMRKKQKDIMKILKK